MKNNKPFVALDKTLTPELVREGNANELSHIINGFRRLLGVKLDSKIILCLTSEMKAAPIDYEKVAKECLVESLVFCPLDKNEKLVHRLSLPLCLPEACPEMKSEQVETLIYIEEKENER